MASDKELALMSDQVYPANAGLHRVDGLRDMHPQSPESVPRLATTANQGTAAELQAVVGAR
jgi:hypothetical protein